MQIFVKLEYSKVYEVDPMNTVENIYERILDREGIPKRFYYLTSAGKVLSKGTLLENNVTQGSTILIHLRMCPV